MSLRTLAILSFLALTACGEGPQPTAIYLNVDTELDVPGEVTTLALRVEREGGTEMTREIDLATRPRPGRLRIDAPPGGEESRVRLAIAARNADRDVVTRTIRTSFVRDRVIIFSVLLERACRDVECTEADHTCIGGGCTNDFIDPSTRDVWTEGEPGPPQSERDGSVGLDGGMDGGLDAAIDTPDTGVSCPDAGMADAGAPQMCEEDVCPTPRSCEPTLGCWLVVGRASDLSAGARHLCVVGAGLAGPTNVVACAGDNDAGQLGGEHVVELAEQRYSQPLVVAFSVPGSMDHVAAGNTFTCLGGSDTIECWGDGARGWGDAAGACGARSTLQLPDDRSLRSMDAGDDYACALDASGDVWCWGNGSTSERGNPAVPASTTPRRIEGLGTAVGIVVGARHACAWSADGMAWCWGANGRGQLGDGSSDARDAAVAVTVADGPVRAMAAGGQHTCALIGTVGALQAECWGDNEYGQLGNDTAARDLDGTILDFGDGREPLTIDSGLHHSCVVLDLDPQPDPDDPGFRCWGYGDDARTWRTTASAGPVPPSRRPVGWARLPIRGLGLGDEHSCVLDEEKLRCAGPSGGFLIPALLSESVLIENVETTQPLP